MPEIKTRTKRRGAKRMRRSVLKSTVLSVLNALGEVSIEIIDQAFLNPAYAFTHPTRELLGLNKKYKYYDADERRRLFSVVMRRLQKEGLVAKLTAKRNAPWKILFRGKQFLKEHNAFSELPPKDGKTRIFSFDVPEKERWKRNRLRGVLVSCDYEMLQQSVWIGTRPLPENAFNEFGYLRLMDKIHIFEVSQKGTIKQVNTT